MAARRVLIAGCGYVGSALGRLLDEDGELVWGLRRHVAALPPCIRPVQADLLEGETLADLPGGLTHVVYAPSPGGRSESHYRAVFVDGLRHLLRALEPQTSSITRLVFVSSTAVYGQADGSWVDESSPTDPPDATAACLLRGEEQARAGPLPGTVVRMAGIYGPGRTRLLESVRSGQARLPVDRPRWTNRIHQRDCAGLLRHLIRHPAPAPLYLGVDHQPCDLGEVMEWLAEELGVAPPPSAPTDSDQGAVGRRHRSNKRCNNDAVLRAGYTFSFPTFREGYRDILRRQE